MNKTLSKEIYVKNNRSNKNKTIYVKQRTHCVSLLRKTKRAYYSNLDKKNICDNNLENCSTNVIREN